MDFCRQEGTIKAQQRGRGCPAVRSAETNNEENIVKLKKCYEHFAAMNRALPVCGDSLYPMQTGLSGNVGCWQLPPSEIVARCDRHPNWR